MTGTLLEAHGTTGAKTVVIAVTHPGAQLDDRMLGAGTEAAIALEAVAAGEAAPGLIGGFALAQAPDNFVEAIQAAVRIQVVLALLAASVR